MQEKTEYDRQKERDDELRRTEAIRDRERGHFAIEEAKRYEQREHELLEYRQLLEQQEKEFEKYRTKQKQEQMRRERELQTELEAREKLFADREKQFVERQREFETFFAHRQEVTDAIRLKLESEISKREAELADALQQLNQEKERYSEESRRKIERTSKDYVSDALLALDRKDIQFHRISKIWSAIGAFSLIGGLGFFGYVTVVSFATLPNQMTWEFIIFSLFKGLIAVALFGALAKYAFLFSNSYMREALKNGDRRHAINFGKFYLESYGAAAEWTQIKEAFENWNIMGPNAFSKPDESRIDVTTLEKAAAIIEKIGKSLPTVGGSKGDSSSK